MREGEIIEGGFWDGTEVISVYTRAQAIEDGVLVECDRDGIVKEAGFKVPVAVTHAVWTILEPTDEEREGWGQSVEGRLWDLLWMARVGGAVRQRVLGDGSHEKHYEALFQMRGREDYRSGLRKLRFKLISGPGDEGEHVITIMLPEES
jgi:hypothetical protein